VQHWSRSLRPVLSRLSQLFLLFQHVKPSLYIIIKVEIISAHCMIDLHAFSCFILHAIFCL